MHRLEGRINRIERQIESPSEQDEQRLRCLTEIAARIGCENIPTELLSGNTPANLNFPGNITLADIAAKFAGEEMKEIDNDQEHTKPT